MIGYLLHILEGFYFEQETVIIYACYHCHIT